MKTFIALLRGINVSGQKIIKMQELRAALESLGLVEVKTYVQSGNVVFKSSAGSAASLGGKIAEQIKTSFGFDVPVFVLSANELQSVAGANPFTADPSIDASKLHVTFLDAPPPKGADSVLQTLAATEERFHVGKREIYLYCPNGYGNTKLSNTAIEKKLGVGATTRNWKTVNALLAMAAQ